MTSQLENMMEPATECLAKECNAQGRECKMKAAGMKEPITKEPITKESISDIMASMRVKGAPASDKIKKDYGSRLRGLLKRGILEVLDQPELFQERWNAQGWTACNSLSYIKAVGQWISSLHQTGSWQDYYTGSLDNSALAIRDLSRHLNTQNKLELANKD